jgi:hypothetical protein
MDIAPHEERPPETGVEMPRATAWPLALSVGVTLLAAGLITHPVLSLTGVVLLVAALAGWIWCLMPGQGHDHEPLAPPEERPAPTEARPGTVEQMRPDMPGYRFRLPEKIHPISAGLKGGLIGGLVMPIPALAYGILSGNGIWFVINLLAGMVFPAVEQMPGDELQQFSLTLFVVAVVIHAILSAGFGLIYGVLLPTLPQFRGAQPLFGGILLPLLWSGFSYGLMGTINPALEKHVNWPFFILSQVVFGLAASAVVVRSEQVYIEPIRKAGEGPAGEAP